jgi:hypothetical protein
MRMSENRALRRVSGPKREEEAGGWRRLHNKELHNLYTLPYVIRMIKSMSMRRAGHVARMEETKNIYNVLVRKPDGKRPLGRPRRTWEDNITMGLREIV